MKRLDKILADAGVGTRSEIKQIVRQGRVYVDGQVCNDCDKKLNENGVTLTLDGMPVRTDTYYYIMMNKPAGVVSATEDSRERTVIDILPERYRKLGLIPVGRLDKDTEGLLLLTNDGAWAHGITSPARHVEKEYAAQTDKPVTVEDIEAFRQGITLRDGTKCLPAGLENLDTEHKFTCRVTLTEGKYHQVKRMLAARGIRVLHLERIRLGPLSLDEALPRGGVRELTIDERDRLK